MHTVGLLLFVGAVVLSWFHGFGAALDHINSGGANVTDPTKLRKGLKGIAFLVCALLVLALIFVETFR